MPLTDKELIAELKICKKNKKRNFLFAAGSKIEDHYLELSKKKIPRSKAKDAKKAAGAPKAYAGVVEFDKDTGEIVFKTNLNFADKQGKALRMLVKKRLGLTSFTPVLKLEEDLVEEDFDDDAEAAPGMSIGGATQTPPQPSTPPESRPETQEVRPNEDKPDIPTPQPPDTMEVRPNEDQPDPMEAQPPMTQSERDEAAKEVRKIEKELKQIAEALKVSL